jgi:hypothetical protein
MSTILFVLTKSISMMILHRHCIHCNNVKTYINIDFSITCCCKANDALHQFFGSHSKQYRLIRKYTSTILNTNPSNNSYVQSEKIFFQMMYICLDAYKNGFKYGCLPIICLDACHLKGEYEE